MWAAIAPTSCVSTVYSAAEQADTKESINAYPLLGVTHTLTSFTGLGQSHQGYITTGEDASETQMGWQMRQLNLSERDREGESQSKLPAWALL